VVNALPGSNPFEDFLFRGMQVLRDESQDRLAYYLLGCVSEHAAGALIPACNDAVQILANNAVVGRIDNRSQQKPGVVLQEKGVSSFIWQGLGRRMVQD